MKNSRRRCKRRRSVRHKKTVRYEIACAIRVRRRQNDDKEIRDEKKGKRRKKIRRDGPLRLKKYCYVTSRI